MDRDSLVKIQVIERILDKSTFDELLRLEPFAAGLMLDNFKEFLSDDYFEKVERQLTLYKFLRCYYPLEVATNIIDYASNCDLSEDYTKLIMEWNLVSSEYIREYHLNKYDCSDFVYSSTNNNDPNYILVDCGDLIPEGLLDDQIDE